jgi:spore coat protein H
MKKTLVYILGVFLIISCTKKVAVFDNNANANFVLPLIFKLNSKNCVYDSETKTLKYSLDANSLTQFSPLVEFQEYSEIKLNGVSLVNKTINNIGDVELYKEYNLTVTILGEVNLLKLVFTAIPLVQIVTLDRITNEPKILGKLLVNYPSSQSHPVESWIGIEVRGKSTIGLDKKSYGFELYNDRYLSNIRFDSFFDMKPNNKWILDAMFIDASCLRNKTTFDVWKSMSTDSSKIAIKSKFVEVFLNSKSLGLYCFNESYTKQFLNLNNQSVFYTGIDNSDATKFYDVPNSIFNSGLWGEWEQKYPNPSQYINWGDFKALNELVVNVTDTEFINTIEQKLDLTNVIDYYIFVNLCNGYDNVGKNWFFLKKNYTDKFQIVPWDLDATWGKNSQGELLNSTTLVTNGLFERLVTLNPNNFKGRLKNRWNSLRISSFSETNIQNLFETNFNKLNDYQIIEVENSVWNKNVNLNSEKNYINSWISSRLTFLDNYFSNL